MENVSAILSSTIYLINMVSSDNESLFIQCPFLLILKILKNNYFHIGIILCNLFPAQQNTTSHLALQKKKERERERVTFRSYIFVQLLKNKNRQISSQGGFKKVYFMYM